MLSLSLTQLQSMPIASDVWIADHQAETRLSQQRLAGQKIVQLTSCYLSISESFRTKKFIEIS